MLASATHITEKQFQQQVIDLARLCGFRVYHTWLSIRSAATLCVGVISLEEMMHCHTEIQRSAGSTCDGTRSVTGSESIPTIAIPGSLVQRTRGQSAMECRADYPLMMYARCWPRVPAIIVEGPRAWTTHHDSVSITSSRFIEVDEMPRKTSLRAASPAISRSGEDRNLGSGRANLTDAKVAGRRSASISHGDTVTPATLRVMVSEKEFMGQVIALARILGWKVYHTFDSRRSEPGWPDLSLLRGPRLIFAELKSDRGTPTPAQREWLEALRQVPGVEVYVFRPSDWDEIVRIFGW